MSHYIVFLANMDHKIKFGTPFNMSKELKGSQTQFYSIKPNLINLTLINHPDFHKKVLNNYP